MALVLEKGRFMQRKKMKSMRMNAGGSRKRTRRKIERNVPLMTKLEAESLQTPATSGRNKDSALKESTKAGCRRIASPLAMVVVLTFTRIAQDGQKKDTATKEGQETNGCP